MAPLRQRRLEDPGIRNLAPNTQLAYVQQISAFARHFDCSPDLLGPEQVRARQVHLLEERKLAAGSLLVVAAAFRFLFKITLRRPGNDDDIPMPRRPQRLPIVLSPEEVVHFLACVASTKHRTILTTIYDTGLRVCEAVHLRPGRHRQPAHGGSRRPGQGPQGPLRDALAAAAAASSGLLAAVLGQVLAEVEHAVHVIDETPGQRSASATDAEREGGQQGGEPACGLDHPAGSQRCGAVHLVAYATN